MVAFIEGIDRGLPVAFPLDRDVARERHLREVVRVEVQRHRLEELAQRSDGLVEAEPDEPAPGVAGQLDEPAAGRCALRESVEVGDALEAAVDLVFPVVVLALERCGARCALGAQAVPAVQADVVKRAHRPVLLPHQQHRLAADLGADVVAGLGDIGFEAAKQPDLGPHALPLETHEIGGGVAFFGDRIAAQAGVGGFLGGRAAGDRLGAAHLAVGGRTRRGSQRFAVEVSRSASRLVSGLVVHRLVGHVRLGHPSVPSSRAAQRTPRPSSSRNAGTGQLPRSIAGYSAIKGCMS